MEAIFKQVRSAEKGENYDDSWLKKRIDDKMTEDDFFELLDKLEEDEKIP